SCLLAFVLACGVLLVVSFVFVSFIFFFFFSSRRRHTRCYRDWSSDVCSSDLLYRDRLGFSGLVPKFRGGRGRGRSRTAGFRLPEIGRASCRERVEMWGVGVSLKKKRREYNYK